MGAGPNGGSVTLTPSLCCCGPAERGSQSRWDLGLQRYVLHGFSHRAFFFPFFFFFVLSLIALYLFEKGLNPAALIRGGTSFKGSPVCERIWAWAAPRAEVCALPGPAER